MQEHVEERSVALSIKATKITGRLLAKAMEAFLKKMKEPSNKPGKPGRHSIKSLTKDGSSLTSVPINGENIGSFDRIARKHNVKYELKRDYAEKPPNWMVYFKAKDADSMTSAFNEYAKIQLKQKTRKPSLLGRLQEAKELVAAVAPPVKNRNKGGHEL